MANPFAQAVNSVGTLSAGHIVLATEWNAAVGGLYSYVNATLLAGGLNVLSNQGDMYAYSGAGGLSVLATGGAGNDGKVMTARSTAPNGLGVQYEAIANTTALTTKGDLVGYGTNLTRIPVGADGTFLKADSTQTLGVKWDTPPGVPLGAMVLWDLSRRAMPAGFNLCDGGTYNGFVTPNSQGLYLVGAGLANNPPATGGMGAVACGVTAGDTSHGTGLGPAHAHSFTVPTGNSNPGAAAFGSAIPGNYTTGSATITPRYLSIALIMRTL